MVEVLKGFSELKCSREREMALELFSLVKDGKITPLAEQNFNFDEYDVYFNTGSGNVFLSDSDYNTIMERDGELDLFISLGYGGEEGFFDELMDIYDDLHKDDKEQLFYIANDGLKGVYKKQFKQFLK